MKIPPSKSNWSGRAGALHESVQCASPAEIPSGEGKIFGILGFACDEGVRRNNGRPGAKAGPEAIRKALAKLPAIEGAALLDFGDIACEGESLEEAQQELGKTVEKILAAGALPIVLGGGHEAAWGHYLGLPKSLSIVNFDAHFDLRTGKPSSGTPFQQIAAHCEQYGLPFLYSCLGIQKSGNSAELFEAAKSLNVGIAYAEDFHFGASPIDIVEELLQRPEPIFLSICMDVFAASAAPGVSAPQPLGIHPWHVIPLLRRLAASEKVISLDVAELSPPFDQDGRTAALAASLIWEFIKNA